MESPFNRLTESDKLRSFVDTRSFAEDLAASNAKLFQTEALALGIDKQRNDLIEEEKKRAAEDSYSRNVLSKSQNTEDMLARSRQWMASNPGMAKYADDSFVGANRMFEGADLAKQRNIASRQAEVQTRSIEGTYKSKIELDNINNSINIIKNGEELSMLKGAKILESQNPAMTLVETIDANNPVHVSIARAYNNSMKNAVTEDQKSAIKTRTAFQLRTFDDFKTTQNQFTQDTVTQYSETMNNLLKKQEVMSAYDDWYASKKDEGATFDKRAGFIKFLGDMSEDFDAPHGIGPMIARSDPKARALMYRAYNMKKANDAYNAVIGSIDKKTGAYSGDKDELDQTLDYTRLKNATEKVKNDLQAEKASREATLKQREAELNLSKTEQDIESGQLRDTALYGAEAQRLQSLEKAITAKTTELNANRRIAAQKPNDKTNALVVQSQRDLKELEGQRDSILKSSPRTSVPNPK